MRSTTRTQSFVDSDLTELFQNYWNEDNKGFVMGIRKRKRRKQGHLESRPLVDGGEFGFRTAISGLLLDDSQRLLPSLPGNDRIYLIQQLASQPNLLVQNWLGLTGAVLDFELLVDVYLHLCDIAPQADVYYEHGSHTPLTAQNNNSGNKGEQSVKKPMDYGWQNFPKIGEIVAGSGNALAAVSGRYTDY